MINHLLDNVPPAGFMEPVGLRRGEIKRLRHLDQQYRSSRPGKKRHHDNRPFAMTPPGFADHPGKKIGVKKSIIDKTRIHAAQQKIAFEGIEKGIRIAERFLIQLTPFPTVNQHGWIH